MVLIRLRIGYLLDVAKIRLFANFRGNLQKPDSRHWSIQMHLTNRVANY